jgi:hypothetical protein
MPEHNHETSNDYAAVVTKLTDKLRVITCKDDLQWILQKRVGGGAKRPWRAKGYFTNLKALTRVSASLGAPTASLDGLHATFRRDVRANTAATIPAPHQRTTPHERRTHDR